MPRRALLVLLLASAALAGCATDAGDAAPATSTPAGASPTPPAAPAQPVRLQVSTIGTYPVDPGFSPATLEAPAGSTITVALANADANPVTMHDWVLEGHEDVASTDAVGSGESAEVTFPAPPPGEYAFYCSVGDHRARGMEGTLRVA